MHDKFDFDRWMVSEGQSCKSPVEGFSDAWRLREVDGFQGLGPHAYIQVGLYLCLELPLSLEPATIPRFTIS